MELLIQPSQVPKVWDYVKLAIEASKDVEGESLSRYLNNLLMNLLSNKAQCFVRLSSERSVEAVLITRIVADNITGDKALMVVTLFIMTGADDEKWEEQFKLVKDFASKTHCKRIIIRTNNELIINMAKPRGFKTVYKCLTLNTED